MKPTPKLFKTLVLALFAAFSWLPNGFAQTASFVTISAQPDTTNNYAVQTNQIISIVGGSSAGGTGAAGEVNLQ